MARWVRSPLRAAVAGIAYRDYDADGSRDVLEPGEPGVLVRGFDATGALVGGPVETGEDGAFTLTIAGATSNHMRVEFALADGRAYLRLGAGGQDAGTAVQFADIAATGLVLAVSNPQEYCQANPALVTNCYVFGDQVAGPGKDLNQLPSFPATARGSIYDNSATATVTGLAANKTVGTTFGLTHARFTATLYSAAFHRVFAGFGPNGPGACLRHRRSQRHRGVLR